MKKQSLALSILFGIEVIVGIRILLFTIPVILSKQSQTGLFPSSLDDWMVIIGSCMAGCYCVSGVFAFLNCRLWKLLQYVSVVGVLVLTVFLLDIVSQYGASVNIIYFIPLIFSILCMICMAFFHKNCVEEK